MDGTCLDANPCESVTCEHGCVNGRCLQNRNARGPDADGDGYSNLADCDDDDPDVNPARREVCSNGVDDNCDGFIDEMPCGDGSTDTDGGTSAGVDGSAGGPGGSGDSDGGCCAIAGSSRPATLPLLWSMLMVLALVRRRRR